MEKTPQPMVTTTVQVTTEEIEMKRLECPPRTTWRDIIVAGLKAIVASTSGADTEEK